MRKLWQHSVGTAMGYNGCPGDVGWMNSRSPAFFAGLFHDVGKLFVLMVADQMKEKNKNLPITNALLMEVLNLLHTDQGYRLMKQWNLPEEYCVITRNHHDIDCDGKNLLLLLVRLAIWLASSLESVWQKTLLWYCRQARKPTNSNLSEIDLAELEILLEDTAVLAG